MKKTEQEYEEEEEDKKEEDGGGGRGGGEHLSFPPKLAISRRTIIGHYLTSVCKGLPEKIYLASLGVPLSCNPSLLQIATKCLKLRL